MKTFSTLFPINFMNLFLLRSVRSLGSETLIEKIRIGKTSKAYALFLWYSVFVCSVPNSISIDGIFVFRWNNSRETKPKATYVLMCKVFASVIIENNNKTFFAFLNNLSTDIYLYIYFFLQLSKQRWNGMEGEILWPREKIRFHVGLLEQFLVKIQFSWEKKVKS